MAALRAPDCSVSSPASAPTDPTMRITEMHITPIALGGPPLLNAAGLHAPYCLRTVVELRTADGLSGLAEVPGSVAVDAALAAVRDVAKPQRAKNPKHPRRRRRAQNPLGDQWLRGAAQGAVLKLLEDARRRRARRGKHLGRQAPHGRDKQRRVIGKRHGCAPR